MKLVPFQYTKLNLTESATKQDPGYAFRVKSGSASGPLKQTQSEPWADPERTQSEPLKWTPITETDT